MAALYRLAKCLGKTVQLPGYNRNISLSATSHLKEFVTTKEGNTLVIEGVIKPDPAAERHLKHKNGACPICASGLDIKHTDVLILNQFVRSDGCILPRRVTGLCEVQQKRISSMIIMAQRAGLMKRGPFLRFTGGKWKKFNTYYDEHTIRERYNCS